MVTWRRTIKATLNRPSTSNLAKRLLYLGCDPDKEAQGVIGTKVKQSPDKLSIRLTPEFCEISSHATIGRGVFDSTKKWAHSCVRRPDRYTHGALVFG